jgi:intracellular sulfur oxidation DsrE/DsrF family protein
MLYPRASEVEICLGGGYIFPKGNNGVERPTPVRKGDSMRALLPLFLLSAATLATAGAYAEARVVQTPYHEPKVVFDFYLDDPRKIDSALFWIRALMNPLIAEPYGMAPDAMDIVVVIHGMEIVTTVKHNEQKYQDAVDRMRYYADLGVKFKVCGIAAHDYGYVVGDFQDFVDIVPSAITELAYWQQQGYATIFPQVIDKKLSVEEIR